MIAMQRISSLHLSTWMSFFVFHNARVPRKCGRFLKCLMKEPMMLREQEACLDSRI